MTIISRFSRSGIKMALRPLQDSFLFEFLNETSRGRFIEKSRTRFILSDSDYTAQADRPRWVRVLAIGPRVEDFAVDDIVLVEYGKWTTSIEFEKKKYWRSAQDFVMAIGDSEDVVYTC